MYKFHSYTITDGCFFIAKELKDDFRVEKYRSSFENDGSDSCEDPFIVDLSVFKNNSDKKEIEVSHNGVTFFVGTVIPSRKEELIPEEGGVEKLKTFESINETNLGESFLTGRSPDISIYYIMTENFDDFTEKEVEESAVALQSKVQKIDVIVTEMFEIPDEKMIRDNSLAVGIKNDNKTALIRYSLIRNPDGMKMVIFKKIEKFPF